MKLKEKKHCKTRTVTGMFRCGSNKTQLCTPWVQVMSADIPVKMMIEYAQSVHLTVYRGNI